MQLALVPQQLELEKGERVMKISTRRIFQSLPFRVGMVNMDHWEAVVPRPTAKGDTGLPHGKKTDISALISEERFACTRVQVLEIILILCYIPPVGLGRCPGKAGAVGFDRDLYIEANALTLLQLG